GAEAVGALAVQPRESAANGDSVVLVLVENEIHERGDTGVGGAPRSFVARDHEIHQHFHGIPFVRREELVRHRSAVRARRRRIARGSLCLLHHRRRCLARGRERRDGHDLEHRPPAQSRARPRSLANFVCRRLATVIPRSRCPMRCHTTPCFRWSAMYSLVRHESARMVHVGFLSACDTKGPPSTTKRFFTSCAWPCALSTERAGSLPMRVVPSS